MVQGTGLRYGKSVCGGQYLNCRPASAHLEFKERGLMEYEGVDLGVRKPAISVEVVW